MSNALPKPESIRPDRISSNRGKTNPYSTMDDVRSGRDWNVTECNAGDILLLIAACIAAGDAKGPIIGITVYHEGEPTKKWTDSPDLFEELVGKFTRLALAQLPAEVQQRLTTSK